MCIFKPLKLGWIQMINLLVILDTFSARNSVMSFRLIQSNLKVTVQKIFLLELNKKDNGVRVEKKNNNFVI